MEIKTDRLTLLIAPAKKASFEALCAQQDLTPSQVVRQLIRDYLTRHGVSYLPSGASRPPKRTTRRAKRWGPRRAMQLHRFRPRLIDALMLADVNEQPLSLMQWSGFEAVPGADAIVPDVDAALALLGAAVAQPQ